MVFNLNPLLRPLLLYAVLLFYFEIPPYSQKSVDGSLDGDHISAVYVLESVWYRSYRS